MRFSHKGFFIDFIDFHRGYINKKVCTCTFKNISSVSLFYSFKAFSCCSVLQSGSKQRIVRRDSSLRVELGELTTEIDLDILGRLDSITQALSHCPNQPKKPGNSQVLT